MLSCAAAAAQEAEGGARSAGAREAAAAADGGAACGVDVSEHLSGLVAGELSVQASTSEISPAASPLPEDTMRVEPD